MSLFACFGGRKRTPHAVDFWDCSNLNLSDLPREVLQHRKTLRQLFMNSNNIRDVPKAIFACEELRELDLSENMILFLPPSIQSLRWLTSLNISKNSLSTVPDSIRECQGLLHLDISSNSLVSLPDGVTELRQLRTLSLNDCQLEELPPNIGRLNKLETLELRENLIVLLPQSMCHMTLLEKLDLGMNEFSTLNGVVGSLESLSELWLDGNLLNSLPEEIGLLRNLKFLEVSENQLMLLPTSLSSMASLQDFYLTDNLLTFLPDSIGELANLKLLKIERNRLSALPETIYGWKNLIELTCSHNHLEDLPPGIGGLKRLEILNVDENNLLSLPAEVGQLEALSVLSLRDNNIAELPPEVGNLKVLSILNLIGNRLQYLPFSLTLCKDLVAIWIAENQNRPLLDLQLVWAEDGEKALTCILLPQNGLESPFEEQEVVQPHHEGKPHSSAVNFDPKVQDRKSSLKRDPTPYPKELHLKALQWRAMREGMAGGVSERPGEAAVSVRSGRRALHRPYSLIRAMSDPIDAENLQQFHRGSRRHEGSQERREYPRTPTPHETHSQGDPENGPTSLLSSSPSPAPLSSVRSSGRNLSPACRGVESGYHGTESARYVRIFPNREFAPEMAPSSLRDTVSPSHSGASGDHMALRVNSNSSNNSGWPTSSSSVAQGAGKSNTFPLAQTSAYPPFPLSPPQLYYQSNAQGHSEASTLSHSDAPDPRYSSSVESGFDADVEQDPNRPWYLAAESSPRHSGRRGQHKRRILSDSAVPSAVALAAAAQDRRRGSDYDHLPEVTENNSRKMIPFPRLGHKGSPLTVGKPRNLLHMSTSQHKSSRSFDTAESTARGRQSMTQRSELELSHSKPIQKSFTAAMKGKVGHGRSRSQPEELIRVGVSLPSIVSHQLARGSQSPVAQAVYATDLTSTQKSQNSSSEAHAPFPRSHSPSVGHRQQTGVAKGDSVFQSPHTPQGRLGPLSPHSPLHPFSTSTSTTTTTTAVPAHQRFPSDSHYTSDDSQVEQPARHGSTASSKRCTTWGVSQDSGFDSMKRTIPAGAAVGSTGTVFKVQLTRDPTFGLGITGGLDGDTTTKPGDTGYHIYKLMEGSPAKKCGLIAVGDKLLEVNQTDVGTLTTADLLSLLSSETHVLLTLYREPSLTLL